MDSRDNSPGDQDGITMADIDDFADVDLNYSPAVMNAISQILPSDDPFDTPDFNAVNYINERFPAEQSLQLLDDALDEMKAKLAAVDRESQELVRKMAADKSTGQESVLFAKEAIAQLSKRFQDIKVASGESEQRVKAITRDIRQLDIGKRNLTTSITTLNHLQMLAEGVDKLQNLKAARQYGELAPLLQGVNNVLQHLKKYSHIPQIKQLQDQVVNIRQELEQQILGEFNAASSSLSSPSQQLAEACMVASVLDCRVRTKIINQVLENQLAEYKALYAGTEKDGWLTCVDLRKKWFLRAAVDFDRTLAQMFPPEWKVPARLAYSFCQLTHSQLTEAMQLRPSDIDSGSMLQAHKLLSDLESLIIQKYGNTFTQQDIVFKDSMETNSSGSPSSPTGTTNKQVQATPSTDKTTNPTSPFEGAITNCFLPYLHIYLETVDKRLAEHIEKFCHTVKNYKFEKLEEEESNVLPCCGELFTIYKNILVEYLRVSGGGHGLGNLAVVFQRHLQQFASRVLRQALSGASSIPLSNIPKDIKDLSSIINNFHSKWVREGEPVRLSSEDEVMRVCSVLVSTEYCTQMTSKLQAKLQQKVEQLSSASTQSAESHLSKNSVSLAAEEDLFHAVLSECIHILMSHTLSLCEPSLNALPKLNWVLEQTGDQSGYVSQLSSHLASTVPTIRYNLHTSRKYFTRYCDKLATSICAKFTQQVYKCRPINSIGCEQLLLDCHALKATLLHMPVVGGQGMREPPASYTRMVSKSLTRAELVLQVVMGEYSSATQLLDKTIQLMPDLSLNDFQKVLEMRGVKEKTGLLEAYRVRTADLHQGDSSPVSSPATPQHELSRIAKLEKMLKARRLI